MSFFEILRFAVRGITVNKLRSALTMLGVLIGVGAVILLVAVGNGSAKQITDRIAALGSNTLTVQSTTRGGSGDAITVPIALALKDPVLAPDVRSVSPVVSAAATITYQGADHQVPQFVGTYPSYLGASNTRLATGSAFSDEDLAQGRRVVLIGQTVATELFPGTDPLGAQVTVGGALYTVLGVLAEKSSATGFQDANDVAVAPLTSVQQTLTGYGPVNSVIVEADGADRVDEAESQVATILDQRLRVTPTGGAVAGGARGAGAANRGGAGRGAVGGAAGQSAPYRIQNAAQLLQTQTETADTFTVLLGAVAGISLLVGGIGITNIMLVTVTERTREIGIRKALGAPRRVILTQFLAEATMLSVVGGGLGVAAALIGSHSTIVGVKPVVVPSSIALALGVSVAIGLFFGSVPASRAAGLRPIDALRYE
ncbi:putative ABC transport system permease protein [Micromonospora pisi]|uniref:Putative ABC transport system permease protein n=1 Tax=Micromonospora pisi TaxID=589240 RepID=A0A495JFB0_9ACTN|nr:ABC transporter permease [Micromonospora pisi]RKR87686.1 putative ABC transport system permease protein [Micromonospora pisi]